MDLGAQAAGIGALAERTRRRLYEYVVDQPEPVGREQTARALGLAQHTVSFHLDRLVDEGLLDVEYRRIGDRTGPGSGRPSKLYRRADREFAVSLPPRRYDLVGDILATAVTQALSGMELAGSVSDAAHDAGVEVGREALGQDALGDASDGVTPSVARLAATLEPIGYEPRTEDDVMVLANCPYHSLARQHTQLVCGLNQHFVQGVVEGLGCEGVTACLEPEDGRCCVVARLTPRDPGDALPGAQA